MEPGLSHGDRKFEYKGDVLVEEISKNLKAE
jgi:hypothetical protein